MRIFHIVRRTEWAAAQDAGKYRPESLRAEGFVHFSYADQVRASRRNHFADDPDLVVVEIDAEQVADLIRVENGFPHVYGAIPPTAAVGIYELDDALFSEAGPAPTDR
jgi:uncharacterized protein (DUF952 family)